MHFVMIMIHKCIFLM
jgi:hypothetical protein